MRSFLQPFELGAPLVQQHRELQEDSTHQGIGQKCVEVFLSGYLPEAKEKEAPTPAKVTEAAEQAAK